MYHNLVYFHIGKTAGTSLRTTLENAFGPGTCSQPFVQNYITAEEAKNYDSFPVICGHISRSDQLKWFPNRRFITILREPIDRCLSFIHYVRSLNPEDAPVAADAHRMTILDLIETDEAQRNLHNTMVRQLGGHMLDAPVDFPRLLEQAKKTLRESFWVGQQESLQDDLARLGSLLGCNLDLIHENVTPARPAFDSELPQVLDRLYSLNGYDLQLWRWWNSEIGK